MDQGLIHALIIFSIFGYIGAGLFVYGFASSNKQIPIEEDDWTAFPLWPLVVFFVVAGLVFGLGKKFGTTFNKKDDH